MEKVRYMISDAANIVHVESHVLRYWEDELELNIPRNEMGHRYYTKENIAEFQRIKELKEQGYQLKAIRMADGRSTDSRGTGTAFCGSGRCNPAAGTTGRGTAGSSGTAGAAIRAAGAVRCTPAASGKNDRREPAEYSKQYG